MAGKPTATQSRDARKPSSSAGTLGAHVSAQSGVVPASVSPGRVPRAELEVSSEPPPAAALRLRVALMDDVPSAAVLIGHNLGIDRRIHQFDTLATPQRFSELSKRLTHDATSPSSLANSARLAATSSVRDALP